MRPLSQGGKEANGCTSSLRSEVTSESLCSGTHVRKDQLTVVAGSLHAIKTLVDLVNEESLCAKGTNSRDTVNLFEPTGPRETW